MSISVIGVPFHSIWVSRLSRVVPGISLTMERSWPISALTSRLLPTFGRPTIAIAGPFESPALLLECGQRFDDAIEQIAGAGAVIGGNRDRLAETELDRTRTT